MWDFSANRDRICLQEDDGFLLSYGQVEEFGVRLAEAVGAYSFYRAWYCPAFIERQY